MKDYYTISNIYNDLARSRKHYCFYKLLTTWLKWTVILLFCSLCWTNRCKKWLYINSQYWRSHPYWYNHNHRTRLKTSSLNEIFNNREFYFHPGLTKSIHQFVYSRFSGWRLPWDIVKLKAGNQHQQFISHCICFIVLFFLDQFKRYEMSYWVLFFSLKEQCRLEKDKAALILEQL